MRPHRGDNPRSEANSLDFTSPIADARLFRQRKDDKSITSIKDLKRQGLASAGRRCSRSLQNSARCVKGGRQRLARSSNTPLS